MNNSITSTSFGAHINTKIKGRNNVMKNITEEFSKRTKDMQGELNIFRDREYPSSICFTTQNKDSGCLITGDYKDIMAEKTGKHTPEEQSKIVTKLINLFKILNQEVSTKCNLKPIDSDITRRQKLLNEHRFNASKCIDIKLKSAFEKLQEIDTKVLNRLEAQRQEIVDKSCDIIDGYAGNDETLKMYSNIVREDQYKI